jgi:hypothetical protein
MKKKYLPTITLDVDQANEVVRQEMMWHLAHPQDTESEMLAAVDAVLRYYSTEEEYQSFLKDIGTQDWREIAQ